MDHSEPIVLCDLDNIDPFQPSHPGTNVRENCDASESGGSVTDDSGSRSSELPVLPPCQICGEKSSGFHYGANTCEACKGFFRRTLKKKEVNFKCTCKGNGRTRQITQKSPCPRCRYQKCLAEGMSKTAIKIGRYTLTKKTENIRAVKRLEESAEKKTVDSSDTDVPSPLLNFLSENMPSWPDSSSPDMDPFCQLLTESLIQPRSESEARPPSESSNDSRQSWFAPGSYDDVIQSLAAAQMQLFGAEYLEICSEGHKEKRKEYSEQYKERMKVLGVLGCLSMEEFVDFYNYTGIDLDNRLDICKEMLDFVEKKTADLVNFVKHIPGFTSIPFTEQLTLIKESRAEMHLLSMNRTIDFDLNVVSVPFGKGVYHFEELHRTFGEETISKRVTLAKKFRDLNLCREEEALVRAIILTFSDREGLERPDLVQEIQYFLLDCLQHAINRRPDPPRHFMAKIISALALIRDVTVVDTKNRPKLMRLPEHKQSMLKIRAQFIEQMYTQ